MRFAIPAGSEEAAGRDVLSALALNNDLDEGGEGSTTFRAAAGRIESRSGGHGWQGEWTSLDEAACLAAVPALAAFNRGGFGSTEGSVTRDASR